jgi:hypothetical protein
VIQGAISVVAQFDPNEEHIASKTRRFVAELLALGDNLARLGAIVGQDTSVEELVGFSAIEISDDGWLHYPKLSRLAQVAPLSMSEQDFLGRCKSLHEIWQKIPNGFVKRILEAVGCPRGEINKLGSVKLLQALLNVAERLGAHDEDANAFNSADAPEGWSEPNERLAALFVAYDLRIADAHETFALALPRRQDLGFDTASLQQGYGRAIDFVMDKVIDAFENINGPLSRILARLTRLRPS